jgi:hypothetical protein
VTQFFSIPKHQAYTITIFPNKNRGMKNRVFKLPYVPLSICRKKGNTIRIIKIEY